MTMTRMLDTFIEKAPLVTAAATAVSAATPNEYHHLTHLASSPQLAGYIPYFAILEGVATTLVSANDLYKDSKNGRDFQLRKLFTMLSGLPLIATGAYVLENAATLTFPASMTIMAVGYVMKSTYDLLLSIHRFRESADGSQKRSYAAKEMIYHALKLTGWAALIAAATLTGPASLVGYIIAGAALTTATVLGFASRSPGYGLFTALHLNNTIDNKGSQQQFPGATTDCMQTTTETPRRSMVPAR